MSYQIIPNIILILAIIGIIVMILRRLPEAVQMDESPEAGVGLEERLQEKGLPAVAVSKIRTWVIFWSKRSWHFMLEAKGIKHQPHVGYRIKKMLGKKPRAAAQPVFVAPQKPLDISTTITKDEAYFLQAIKDSPKDLANYGGLAQVYVDAKNFEEARDVYEYLAKHEPANHDFHAKLGYCFYQMGQFAQSASSYQKSLALDSSHPNRYYNLGLAQKAAGNIEEAQKAFQQAIDLEAGNPKYAEALAELFR